MTLGPLIIDLEGSELNSEERQLLDHPLVGGVILFARNYRDRAQLRRLTEAIRAHRDPAPIIAVDQEGGRVQRFRRGFTRLPPPGRFGRLYDESPEEALVLAEQSGWLMARELLAVGIDLSLAPVLDLNRHKHPVVGDRSFHGAPPVVVELAGAYMAGMKRAGMAATGKHFPGHGGVAADSHRRLPEDERPYEQLFDQDILPFAHLIDRGLDAVMPAHVVYRQVDYRPASYSQFWLVEVLRRRLGFKGLVISDDLSMAGAHGAGDVVDRASLALHAGCDLILLCNNRAGVWQLLNKLEIGPDPQLEQQLSLLRHKALSEQPGAQEARRLQETLEALANFRASWG